MNNLNLLYRYELKKITGRKLFWITLLLCLLTIISVPALSLTGKYYVDGVFADTHYHMFLVDQAYEKALSGRAIDQTLLKETLTAYRKIQDPEGRYTLTDEYQTYARPYSAIYQILCWWGNKDSLKDVIAWAPDETAFYEAREDSLKAYWQSYFLTETEKTFWEEKEAGIQTPFTYFYHEGYSMLTKSFNTLNILMPLFIMISLSGVFAIEHTRRTDQLVLTSSNGKNTVYFAKILAGVTVSFLCCALMILASAVFSLSFYGTEGYSMQIQVTPYPVSYPMTIGASCLIMCGIALILSVLISIMIMILSEILRSRTAAMALSTAAIIAAMICNVPPQYRTASQIWDWLPFSFLNIWNVFDVRTVPVFGHCLVSWQIMPVIYLLFAVLITAGGKHVYQKYQVSGR